MAQLLIVHHTPSPTLQEMLEAVLSGARNDEIEGVTVRTRPALSTTASDLLAADAVILGTPANIGYMSGALKHFFDTVYYPAGTDTTGLAYALYVHGNSDTTGAVRAVESVASGMSWHQHRPPVTVTGSLTSADRAALWELGAVTALAATADGPKGLV